jgi:CBS domain-containing protein
MKKTVADILAAKDDKALFTISPEATVYESLVLMAEKGIGAMPVLEAGTVVGIITERDYARKVELMGKSAKKTTVREIMTSPVVYVRLDQTSDDCVTLMTGIRSRHLPVMNGKKLVGMVSMGDVMKCAVHQQRFMMEKLERHMGPNAKFLGYPKAVNA